MFGSGSNPFGKPSSSLFGSQSVFGQTSNAGGNPFAPNPFGSTITPYGSQTGGSIFGSSPFGTTILPFGAHNSPFGTQATTPTFGSPGSGQQPAFSGQRGGSRVQSYQPTQETDTCGFQEGKLESISAMPTYKHKSHEELRWEDFQSEDKGGPNPAGQSTSTTAFGGSPFGSSSTPLFGQTSANPSSSTGQSNPFGQKPSTFGSRGFASSTTSFGSSLLGVSGTPPFGSTPLSTPFQFGTTIPPFGTNTSSSLFGTSSSSGFGTTPSLFCSLSAQGTPSFSSLNSLVNFCFLVCVKPSLSAPFQPTPPAQTAGTFSFNSANTQAANTSGFGNMLSNIGQNSYVQQPAIQISVVAQSVPMTNPFGTLPAMPQMSIGCTGTSPSIQYGLSSLPPSLSAPFQPSQPAQTAGAFNFSFANTQAGAQATTPTFGSSGFGQLPAFDGQLGGSRVQSYQPTQETDTCGSQEGKLESISAMPTFKHTSHEELRWEDYQLGDKGGHNPAGQSTSTTTFGGSPIGSSSTPAFGQTSANPFSSTTQSNPLAQKTSTFGSTGFATSTTSFGSSLFGVSSTSPFGSTPSSTPSQFGTTPAFGINTSSSLLGTSSSAGFGTTPSLFGSSSAQGRTPNFSSFGNTQSSPLFQ